MATSARLGNSTTSADANSAPPSLRRKRKNAFLTLVVAPSHLDRRAAVGAAAGSIAGAAPGRQAARKRSLARHSRLLSPNAGAFSPRACGASSTHSATRRLPVNRIVAGAAESGSGP